MRHPRPIEAPARRALPPHRAFSQRFLDLRARIFVRLADYYDRDHLIRTGDWMLALAPDAPEHLIVAALLHDLERSVPGGPVLDKASVPWDDETYNRAHCDRSADLAADWLRAQGEQAALIKAVRQPIREHEFGGSPEGDLMQAADSISFLETNALLVAGWVKGGECTSDKAREKLRWMDERIRLDWAREVAGPYFARSIAEVEAELSGDGEQRNSAASHSP